MIRRITPEQLAAWQAKGQPHYLYRCYDADGRLVYIGCTVSIRDRMVVHRADRKSTASALLRQFMDHYEVDADEHPGRIAAHAAEREAIRDEHPLFNMVHAGTPTWMRNHRIAEYIYEKTGLWPDRPVDEDGYAWCYDIAAKSLDALFASAAA